MDDERTGAKEVSLRKQLEKEWFSISELKSSFETIKANPLYRRTPVLRDCSDLLSCKNYEIDLKMESMQISGSYKLRGIIWQMEKSKQTLADQKKRGLVTMSAGNYGLGLATYCRRYGLPCRVVMPDSCDPYKRGLIENLGAKVCCCPTSDMATMLDDAQTDGWLFIHPFDDLNLVCGYGTVLLELIDTVGVPNVLIVPAGPVAGGGLLCGVALAARLLELPTKVFGVEVIGSNATEHATDRTRDSFTGREMKGLPEKYIGENTFRICFDCVDGIVSVSDKDLTETSEMLLNTAGLLVEPFAVSTVAALRSDKLHLCKGEKIVAIIGSRNVQYKDFDAVVQ